MKSLVGSLMISGNAQTPRQKIWYLVLVPTVSKERVRSIFPTLLDSNFILSLTFDCGGIIQRNFPSLSILSASFSTSGSGVDSSIFSFPDFLLDGRVRFSLFEPLRLLVGVRDSVSTGVSVSCDVTQIFSSS